MSGEGARTITLLVHRPGRMVAIVAAVVLVGAGGILIALQYSNAISRGWSLLLMVPMVVGFVALMRTGTTRCEVELGSRKLVLRSIDSSQLLGRTREVAYAWEEVRAARWLGREGGALRIDFRASPPALVFEGAPKNLAVLAAAAQGPR